MYRQTIRDVQGRKFSKTRDHDQESWTSLQAVTSFMINESGTPWYKWKFGEFHTLVWFDAPRQAESSHTRAFHIRKFLNEVIARWYIGVYPPKD